MQGFDPVLLIQQHTVTLYDGNSSCLIKSESVFHCFQYILITEAGGLARETEK